MSKLSESPVGVNERLMTLRLKLAKNRFITIISAYAPTLQSDDHVKERFYEQLDQIITVTPASDRLLILGDFNARVGCDHTVWTPLGKNGVGKENSNGTLLLSKCTEHSLIITNTLFRQKNRNKTTWMHPRSRHWHLIDYAIVRIRDRKEVMMTKAAALSDSCSTDHRMVKCYLKLSLNKPFTARNKLNTRFDVAQLCRSDTKVKELQDSLSNKLRAPPETGDVEADWDCMKKCITDACTETLGHMKKRNEDWFDENAAIILPLVEAKRSAFSAWQQGKQTRQLKEKLNRAKCELQSCTRQLKNDWWTKKAEALEALALSNNSRAVFAAIKAVNGPSRQGLNPLRSADGSVLLKDRRAISKRWEEHFHELLNRNTTVDPSAIDELRQYPVIEEMAAEPTLQEV